jgi:hypothetical protein
MGYQGEESIKYSDVPRKNRANPRGKAACVQGGTGWICERNSFTALVFKPRTIPIGSRRMGAVVIANRAR